jgi:hypothetical protein
MVGSGGVGHSRNGRIQMIKGRGGAEIIQTLRTGGFGGG